MGGSGTAGDPWQITTTAQLENLASYVNAGNGSQTAGKYYKLMNDLVYVARIQEGWKPIGNRQTIGATFQGDFDGNGKKVSGITINRGASDFIGLFGDVFLAHIHNLGVEINHEIKGAYFVGGLIGWADLSTIENCYVIGNVTGTVTVGGLIGVSVVSNISNSYAIGKVKGDYIVGGFVGGSYGTITTSYAGGKVSASVAYAGGFVGKTEYPIKTNYAGGNVTETGYTSSRLIETNNNPHSAIIDCYATGNIIGIASYMGGFVGISTQTDIAYCYATGDINTTGDFVGGFAGANDYSATLNNCVAANNMVSGGISNVDRIAGENTGTLSHNYAYDGMVVTNSSGGDAGMDATIDDLMTLNFYNTTNNWINTPWSIDVVLNSNKSWRICNGETLPFLQWEGIGCDTIIPIICDFDGYGIGTPLDPYRIYYPCQLEDLATFVNSGNGAQTSGKYFKLMNDLDLGGISNWIPIGNGSNYFQGDFDGNGKVISNLTINRPATNYIGLFGYIFNAEIRNIGIETCQITGNEGVGALVGEVSDISTIENCYVRGGRVTGYRIVGGVIGGEDTYSNLTIKNCYAIGNIMGMTSIVGGLVGWFRLGTISNSYAICEVYGNSAIGGLMGHGTASGIIIDSYAGGNVQSTIGFIGGFTGSLQGGFNITDCYATGNVTTIGASQSRIGGLIGVISSDVNIANCYATGNIVTGASNYYIGGLVGSTLESNITSCYATGDISATGGTYIGGLIGFHSGTLRNCVAANNSVTGGVSNVNRIVGMTSATLSNNYAYDNMVITPYGGNAGISTSMDILMSYGFYNTGTNWYNNIPWSIDTNDDPLKIWKICDGETLPFLQWQGMSCSKKGLSKY